MNQTISILRVEDIRPNPRNNRGKLRGIPELAANIKANGLLDPVIVVRDGEIYWLVSGERRHAAHKLLGLETIEARVAEDLDEAHVMQSIVAANDHDPLTDTEKSIGVQEMLLLGVPIEDVAASAGETVERMTKAAAGFKAYTKFAGDDPEPTSIDRFIAVAEFEGDEEAQHVLLTAPEAIWASKADDLRRKRKNAEDIKAAEALVVASGCELISDSLNHEKYTYIRNGSEAPEGAKYGAVQTSYCNTWVNWYTDATDSEEDPEENARRAQEDAITVELEAADKARLELVGVRLGSGGAVNMSDFAEAMWEEGDVRPGVGDFSGPLENLTGFITRMLAAILSVADANARTTFKNRSGYNQGYYWKQYGQQVLNYFEALKADGYVPSAAEEGLLVEIEDFFAEPAGDAE